MIVAVGDTYFLPEYGKLTVETVNVAKDCVYCKEREWPLSYKYFCENAQEMVNMPHHEIEFPGPHSTTPEKTLAKLRPEHVIYAIHLPAGVVPSGHVDRRLRMAFDAAVKSVLGCGNVSMRTKGSVK